jgi:hypothetical protein
MARFYRLSALAVLVLCPLAIAQPPDDPADGPRRDRGERGDRGDRGDRGGDRGDFGGGRRGFGRGGPRFDPKVELERMTEHLTLDEAQQAGIGKLLEAHGQKLQELRGQFGGGGEMMEKFQAAREAMRDARESGDEAQIAEAQKNMDQLREEARAAMEPARKAREEAQKSLHDGIVAQLRDDQKEKFETHWQERMARQGPGGFRGQMRSPAALKSIVDRLEDLSTEQKTQIEQLFTTFQDESRKAPESDLPGTPPNNLNRKLFEDVLNVLTPGQRERVERQLAGRRGNRGEGRDGREGPGRFRRDDREREDSQRRI